MNIKKMSLICSILLAGLVLGGCSGNNRLPKLSKCEYINETKEGEPVDQFALPKSGEEIAILTVKDYGTIKCRLFPSVAPKAVKNFIELAKKGSYNGVRFHRVVEDFVVQTGGESDNIYKEALETKKKAGEKVEKGEGDFPVELSQKLSHFNGALCVARSGSLKEGQGSQFYIVSSNQGKEEEKFDVIEKDVKKFFRDLGYDVDFKFSEEVVNKYKEVGGAPKLDMLYTVMGQVFEGQDVVEKISKCEKKEKNNPLAGLMGGGENQQSEEPKEDIILEKVEIVNFE